MIKFPKSWGESCDVFVAVGLPNSLKEKMAKTLGSKYSAKPHLCGLPG